MHTLKNDKKSRWITVGAKILFGVALASNLFIGSLLYINLQASATVEQTVNEVLRIREELSSHLRTAIVDLQNEFLALPELFRSDVRQKVIETIDRDFQVLEDQLLKGRENFQQYYSRQERRDLANKGFVIQTSGDGLFFSYGVPDDSGAYGETVARKHLASSNPTEDASRLALQVASLSSKPHSRSGYPGDAFGTSPQRRPMSACTRS
jgi:hypothetical protein